MPFNQRPASHSFGLHSSNRHRIMRTWHGMRIMIVTDAWFPQTNGVVSTLAQTAAWLGRFGHEVRMITPRDFRSIACPTYPEIRLSIRALPEGRRAAFSPSRPRRCTSRPRGRSASVRGDSACATACASRRRITRNFRNTCGRDFRSRSGSRTGHCAGSTARPCAAW